MKLLIFTIALMFALPSFGQSYNVQRRDMKLASQGLTEQQSIVDAELADADQLLAAQATSNSVTTTVTSFLAQPDVVRNIVITPGGTTADVPAGDIVVTGTNILNDVISETFTLAANASSASTGSKAFKTVTSVVFPVQDGTGATYDVGTGAKLGLNHCIAEAGDFVSASLGGAFEGTRPTVAADADEVEKNTATLSTALDGSKDAKLRYIQNFACVN